MISRCFCVDISADPNAIDTDFGYTLTFFSNLRRRVAQLFGAPPARIPSFMEIQDRLCQLCCVPGLEQTKNDEAVYFIRPRIDRYGVTDFLKYKKILRCEEEEVERLIQELAKSEICKENVSRKNECNNNECNILMCFVSKDLVKS